MKRVPIERKSRVDAGDFFANHLAGAGKPLIVTDAIDGWRARSKWSFEYLKSTYGTDFVVPSSGMFSTAGKLTRLADFIDHLDAPEGELPGFWVESSTRRPLREPPVPAPPLVYLLTWLAFERHPELHDDIQPAPYFVDDWVLSLDARQRTLFEHASGYEFWALFVGAAGTVSKLHQDYWSTHACLAQIQGRKHALLFSPEDSARLYEGAVDPMSPDFESHPLFADAVAYEGVMEPGDTLFIPGAWWHWVRSLDKSITVSHNFFNATNFNEHMRCLLEAAPRTAEFLARTDS